MTDKEKKNKIVDILFDFYDEYRSNEINRPMIPSIYAGKIIDSLQEEPVSEELEEEIGKELTNQFGTHYDDDATIEITAFDYVNIARHFANWQKEQDKETIELAEDHAMLAGMEKMKHQMINKACDWLKNWSYGYLIEKYGETDIDRNELVKDFKKYMED